MASTDRGTLEALLPWMGGLSWDLQSWATHAELSTWHGVTVDKDGRVVKLALFGQSLQGVVRSTLGKHAARLRCA